MPVPGYGRIPSDILVCGEAPGLTSKNNSKDLFKMLIPFEGVDLEVSSGIYIEKGDVYIAKRNTGWKILSCKVHNREKGFIVPEESEYPYNTYECYRIEGMHSIK